MADEPSRAPAVFALFDAQGALVRQGDADAVIVGDVLNVGPVTVALLDADALHSENYSIEIDLWPGGRLLLTQLGRRFDAFVADLRRERNRVRVAGLLAHGIDTPEVFAAALVDDSRLCHGEIHIYSTHLTAVPEGGDPYQVPLGAITDVRTTDDPPGLIVETDGARVEIRQLGRRRDESYALLKRRIAEQSRLLATLTGHDAFVDGRGVAKNRIAGFDRLVERVTARDRAACASALLSRATGEPRLGFVQLLDPDGEALESPAALPQNWASFLLVPVGARTVLEILAGPSAATYVFKDAPEPVNRDLQALHFRRGPLALTSEQAELTPFNAYRLAIRRLAPLQRLRASLDGRLIHNDAWSDGVARALVSHPA